VPYPAYHRGGAFLVDLLGPTTVAFAVPLWRHRALLRRHARELTLAVLAGSAVAVSTSVALARALGLSRVVVRSLATRSITTPFAMIVADMVGGAPALAAVFVIVTGVLGVAIAQGILRLLPLRSAVARGALFGMGAHGVGTARAMELGHVEGTVSGLVMILAGLTGLATAPIVRLALGP
jgi:putative effector of murein hydrolase